MNRAENSNLNLGFVNSNHRTIMKPVIATALTLLSAFSLQAPAAFSQTNETLSLQTHQSMLVAQQSNRRSSRPALGRPTDIQAPASVVGNWSGTMNNKGSDILTYIELNVQSGNGAIKYGTWSHVGQNKQGSAAVQKVGNQVRITFHNFNGESLNLQGSFKNGGLIISGSEVNNPNYGFSFSKQQSANPEIKYRVREQWIYDSVAH